MQYPPLSDFTPLCPGVHVAQLLSVCFFPRGTFPRGTQCVLMGQSPLIYFGSRCLRLPLPCQERLGLRGHVFEVCVVSFDDESRGGALLLRYYRHNH